MNWAFSARGSRLPRLALERLLSLPPPSPSSWAMFSVPVVRDTSTSQPGRRLCTRKGKVFGRFVSLELFAKQRGGIGSVLGFRDGFLRGAQ